MRNATTGVVNEPKSRSRGEPRPQGGIAAGAAETAQTRKGAKLAKEFPLCSKGFNPMGEALGLEFTWVGEGASRCTLEVGKRLFNPHGVLHGAAMYSMADTGMGGALYSLLGDGELCATVEISIYYFKPVRTGTLVCETRVVQRTRRVALLSSEIKNGDSVVARATGTFYIFEVRPEGLAG